jgi:hypothetical protein
VHINKVKRNVEYRVVHHLEVYLPFIANIYKGIATKTPNHQKKTPKNLVNFGVLEFWWQE